jgi:hypothetical protein
MDQFQRTQIRAGWTLCLSVGAISSFVTLMRAPSVGLVVLIISIVHVIFYYFCVSRPSEHGLQTTRDFLLMINNRAMSVALVLLTFAVTMIGLVATSARVTLAHIGGLVALSFICAILGSRYAATQWRTRSDLERTARDSTKLGLEFRNKYGVFFFASIGVAGTAAARYFGDNVVLALIATASSALAAHLSSYLITKQLIVLKLLPKEEGIVGEE